MGDCGVPTITCILLLLFMAALYASVSSKEYDAISNYDIQADDVMRSYDETGLRFARSPRRSNRRRQKTNNRDDERKEDERKVSGGSDNNANTPSSSRRRGGNRRPRPEGERIPEGGRRRPRPRGQGDGLPPGVNRRMMRLAEKIHSASTPFTVRLFAAVAPRPLSNIVISPFSVHTALTMTMLGARRRTEKEMSNVLGHRQAKLRNKKPHHAYKGLLSSLQNVHSEVKIFSANAVFVRPGIPLEDSFRQGLTQLYDATFNSFELNHTSGPEAPINSWVSNVTRNKIMDLLPRGSITPATEMVLVNAVYFNASWTNPFASSRTRPGQFNTLDRGVKSVDFMNDNLYLRYGNHYNTEVIELPFKGNRLAMYILLPNPTSNITQLLQGLADTGSFDRFFENLNQTHLTLSLPKFRVESGRLDLTPQLKGMGMVRAFGSQADFSGISSSDDLHISSVIHKAFIDVHEAGTEAAAATAVLMVRGSVRDETQVVKVDRPFSFVIRDNEKKVVLFIGTYVGQ